MGLDFKQYQRLLAEAARDSFSSLRAANPDQTFYTYALYSSDSACGPSPSANTEEFYKRRSEIGVDEKTAALSRWSTAEWGFEGVFCEPFHPLWEVQKAEDTSDGFDWDDPNSFAHFRLGLFGAMIGALHDLDAAGFFGHGADRSRVTLLCSISDGGDAVWLEQESARRLNPPEVFAAFQPQQELAARCAYGKNCFEYRETHREFAKRFGG